MAINFSSIALTVVPAPSTPAGTAAEETTEAVQPEAVQAEGSTLTDSDMQQLMQDFKDQQHDFGTMSVIGMGLIIGILLCGLVRWWR